MKCGLIKKSKEFQHKTCEGKKNTMHRVGLEITTFPLTGHGDATRPSDHRYDLSSLQHKDLILIRIVCNLLLIVMCEE